MTKLKGGEALYARDRRRTEIALFPTLSNVIADGDAERLAYYLKETGGSTQDTLCGSNGKLSEMAGRKAIGTKAVLSAKSAWLLIIKSKPPETAGRKVTGTKASNRYCQPDC